MSDAVTQETLRVLLPSKIALAVDEISRKTGQDALDVLPSFYASRVYRELENEKSKYWCFSPAELCDLFLLERQQTVQRQSVAEDGPKYDASATP